MTRPLRVAAEERSERRPHIIERRGVPTQKLSATRSAVASTAGSARNAESCANDGRSASASQGARSPRGPGPMGGSRSIAVRPDTDDARAAAIIISPPTAPPLIVPPAPRLPPLPPPQPPCVTQHWQSRRSCLCHLVSLKGLDVALACTRSVARSLTGQAKASESVSPSGGGGFGGEGSCGLGVGECAVELALMKQRKRARTQGLAQVSRAAIVASGLRVASIDQPRGITDGAFVVAAMQTSARREHDARSILRLRCRLAAEFGDELGARVCDPLLVCRGAFGSTCEIPTPLRSRNRSNSAAALLKVVVLLLLAVPPGRIPA